MGRFTEDIKPGRVGGGENPEGNPLLEGASDCRWRVTILTCNLLINGAHNGWMMGSVDGENEEQ